MIQLEYTMARLQDSNDFQDMLALPLTVRAIGPITGWHFVHVDHDDGWYSDLCTVTMGTEHLVGRLSSEYTRGMVPDVFFQCHRALSREECLVMINTLLTLLRVDVAALTWINPLIKRDLRSMVTEASVVKPVSSEVDSVCA